jgi:hypothetical protein
MKGRIMGVSALAALLLAPACDDDWSDQRPDGNGSAGLDGESSDSATTAAGGVSARSLGEASIAACEKWCALEAVLSSAIPCETGDLVVRGALVRRADGGAGGAAEPASPSPSCLEECLAALENGAAYCEPAFVAMTDCLAEVVWSCTEPSAWRAHECDVQVVETSECLTE